MIALLRSTDGNPDSQFEDYTIKRTQNTAFGSKTSQVYWVSIGLFLSR